MMKAEYNLNNMKRRGHPLRERVRRGEVKLVDPFDIPEAELAEKLAALDPGEREFVERYVHRGETACPKSP
jgi:hypothetical protein